MSLQWEVLSFGEKRAKDGIYEFIVWGSPNPERDSELRVIRKDNVGGMIVPFQDLTIYVKDEAAGVRLANKLSKAFSRASRRY